MNIILFGTLLLAGTANHSHAFSLLHDDSYTVSQVGAWIGSIGFPQHRAEFETQNMTGEIMAVTDLQSKLERRTYRQEMRREQHSTLDQLMLCFDFFVVASCSYFLSSPELSCL